jgi:Xaa-Pro aminopeptidase
MIKYLLSAILLISWDYHYPYSDNSEMEYFQNRREKLNSELEDYQIYLAFSADFYTTQEYKVFRQNSDLYYLTGFPDEKAIFLFDPNGIDKNGKINKSLIFMDFQPKSDITWHGVKMTKGFVEDSLGIDLALPIEDFADFMVSNYQNTQEILVAPFTKGKHFTPYKGSKNQNNELDLPLVNSLKNQLPYTLFEVDNKILKQLREIKDEKEIELVQKAVNISSKAHIKAIKSIKPNLFEYQIEAIMEGEFHYLGAENVGYNSIVGTGENSCWLHYTRNSAQLNDGDLILMDCSAEYHGYTADITRTVPVNGKFTSEQKAIYNLVLRAQEEAISECKAGVDFFYCDSIAKSIISKGLVDLKIIEDESDYRKYFPHGTSHYLGLDVHDVGTYGKLKSGNVITIEPGVYIPAGSDCDKKWWNIGVRIEDDILVTDNGCKVLSKDLPKSVEEIEELMKDN